jgi:hypothetical protein
MVDDDARMNAGEHAIDRRDFLRRTGALGAAVPLVLAAERLAAAPQNTPGSTLPILDLAEWTECSGSRTGRAQDRGGAHEIAADDLPGREPFVERRQLIISCVQTCTHSAAPKTWGRMSGRRSAKDVAKRVRCQLV